MEGIIQSQKTRPSQASFLGSNQSFIGDYPVGDLLSTTPYKSNTPSWGKSGKLNHQPHDTQIGKPLQLGQKKFNKPESARRFWCPRFITFRGQQTPY